MLVSHRLSNVTMCNKIIVMEDGMVSEMGDHHTLMNNGGTYAQMYATQAGKYLYNE